MFCHLCNGEIKSPTKCKCGLEYCCHDCLMKDKFHKTICGDELNFNHDFEISEGICDNGVFINKSIKAGQILFSERALSNDGKIVSKRKMERVMMDIFPRPGGVFTYEDKLRCSGIHGELFYNASFINNDCCKPNAGYFYHSKHNILIIIAIRDIEKNQEITISYLQDFQNHRTRILQDRYGFTCKCIGCVEPKYKMVLKRLAILDDLLDKSKNPYKILEFGQKFLQELDKIEASPLYYYGVYCHMQKFSYIVADPNYLHYSERRKHYFEKFFGKKLCKTNHFLTC